MTKFTTTPEYRLDNVPTDVPISEQSDHFEALQRMRTLDSYYRWSLDLVAPWIGNRILDAGCGVGNGTASLCGRSEYILAVDMSRHNLDEVERRFAAFPHVETECLDLADDFSYLASRRFDTIICLDVLEHVLDDLSLLRRFFAVAQPGGHLLLKVPACPWLFGTVDKASGHYRRYSKKTLADRVRDSGWLITKSSYMNIF